MHCLTISLNRARSQVPHLSVRCAANLAYALASMGQLRDPDLLTGLGMTASGNSISSSNSEGNGFVSSSNGSSLNSDHSSNTYSSVYSSSSSSSSLNGSSNNSSASMNGSSNSSAYSSSNSSVNVDGVQQLRTLMVLFAGYATRVLPSCNYADLTQFAAAFAMVSGLCVCVRVRVLPSSNLQISRILRLRLPWCVCA